MLSCALLLCAACDGRPTLSIAYPERYSPGRSPGQSTETDTPVDRDAFAFGLGHLLSEEARQVMLVLYDGADANFWLYEYTGEEWHTHLGPRYCTVSDGLGDGQRARAAEWLRQEAGDGVVLSARDYADAVRVVDAQPTVLLVAAASDVAWHVAPGLPDGFVFLSDATDGILEDVRYAGTDNFMGVPFDGYYGDRIVVTEQMAAALQRAQNALQREGYALLVFDGYRPQRAVDHAKRWMQGQDQSMKDLYYPNIEKGRLFSLGYLADPSPHTAGLSVDLTIVHLKTGQELDMGGGFDFFDESSTYNSTKITKVQLINRKLLRDTMIAAGFAPFELEWWHFNLQSNKQRVYYDFIIGR